MNKSNTSSENQIGSLDAGKIRLQQKIHHEGARTHVTGESIFVDDIVSQKDELQVSYLGSPVASGVLKSIDFSQALKIPGVVGVLTAKDIKANLWGTIKQDQPLLISDRIGYKDEPVCIIVAETKQALAKAKKRIVLKIENSRPVLSLREAIEKKYFLYSPLPFIKGEVESCLQSAPHTLKGQFEIGGQEHFYLESQATIAYPVEGNQIKVISSTQHPTETQHLVAHALGLDYHQVICEVRRMGGAFGGKESQAAPFAAMAALAALKYKRSARITLSKDDDMKVTGKRHPFLNFYEVAFSDSGKILGLKVKLYADGGAYTDLSPSILDRAMFHIDGSYYIENAIIEAWVCKTNTHSNTAFRGFGGPQGNLTIEYIIEDIAKQLSKDAAEIRTLNSYQKTERNITPYGQILENNLLPDLFSKILISSEYKKRRKEIEKFNVSNSGKIKGLSLTACKFGISFTAKFLNQGNALIHIHRDGSIQVSTGATEMGQGVNTKIGQVVAHEFGILPSRVQVLSTSTEKNANTSPTAASSGSDINCSAAYLACKKIKTRFAQMAIEHFSKLPTPQIVAPLFEFETESESAAVNRALKEVQFEKDFVFFRSYKMPLTDLIELCYLNRISISDYAHYKTDGLSWNRKSLTGNAFKYFTPGVAVSEVLVDSYTGEMKILRSDLLMDIGRPMNLGIDRGQIAGGFIQGVGWVTSEKLFYDQAGGLLSHSPTTYKIPNIQDLPRVFKIDLMENDLNENNIAGSKAVGEPPLLLSASVFMAIKNALSYRSKKELVNLSLPATPEVILMELQRYEL